MTTTEGLPVLQPAQLPTIITKQCNDGWITCIADDPCKWEWGRSEAEAIGKLHITHQDILGAIQRQEP
jgi:hypothetical protein